MPGISSGPPSQKRLVHVAGGQANSAHGTVTRRLPFATVSQQDLEFFNKLLPGRTITDPDLLESGNVDWLKSVKGAQTALLLGGRSSFYCGLGTVEAT